MLTKEEMLELDGAVRNILVERQNLLKLSDEKLGKQAFGYLAAPRGKIQSLFVGQGAPGKRKPQVINIAEMMNLCEALGLNWVDVCREALKAVYSLNKQWKIS